MNIVFRIHSKFDRFLTLSKDPYEIGEHNNVVFKVSCKCGKCYLGQTKRPLRIRLDEHLKNFNLNKKFHNVISRHRKKYENNQENHGFLWNDVKILHKERDRYKRAFSEMVFIKEENENSLMYLQFWRFIERWKNYFFWSRKYKNSVLFMNDCIFGGP